MKISIDDFITAFIPVPCVVAITNSPDLLRHTMSIIDLSSTFVHGLVNTIFAGLGSTCALIIKSGLKRYITTRNIRRKGKRIKPRTIVWWQKEKKTEDKK